MKAFAKVYDFIIAGLAALAGLIVAAMVAVIVVDVVARNLGFVPPAATVALTEYALLYFTMAAAPWLTRQKAHVTVLVVLDRLRPTLRARAAVIVALVCAGVSFVLAALSGALMIESLRLADIEPRSIDVPRWLLFLPLLVGFFFTGTEFARAVVRGEDVTRGTAERL